MPRNTKNPLDPEVKKQLIAELNKAQQNSSFGALTTRVVDDDGNYYKAVFGKNWIAFAVGQEGSIGYYREVIDLEKINPKSPF